MKFLLKSISYILVFLLAFLVFLPKVELFNLLEKNLEKNSIIISNEIKKDKYISLQVKDSTIYFEKIKSAYIENIDIFTLLFYSKIEFKNILVAKEFQNFLPQKISNITIKHSIIDFKTAYIKASGDFGSLNGNVDILNRKLVAILEPSSIMKSKYRNLLSQFKLKDGKYYYEQRF
ncbi:MAG: hypothetical protein ACNI25_09005 [Halarcobacter sp.]